MNHKLSVAALLLLSCCYSGGVTAADNAGNYAIWGVGRASCHQFLKSRKDDSDTRFRVFLMGYLTAFNTLRDNTYDITAGRSIIDSLQWIETYCESHQMDAFDRAIQQLLDHRYAARHQVPPGQARGWGRATSTEPTAPAAKENAQP